MFVLVGIGLTADWSNCVILEQQTLEFSKSLLGFGALLPEVLQDWLLRKRHLNSKLLLCHSLGACEFLVALDPNHPLVWHLQGLLYGRACAVFGFPWISADLVTELALCLTWHMRRAKWLWLALSSRVSTARSASLCTKTSWRTWSEKAEFTSESLTGWSHFRFLTWQATSLKDNLLIQVWFFCFLNFSLYKFLWIIYLRDNSVSCVLGPWPRSVVLSFRKS